mmetsp:Transcript_17414/g.29301  ORF Transcript_17414/g.29301 Transcript_17414/m.29301 type:complete len:140 (+) Transcript_17414:178-597(+)|eukprot:CAMPEP_0168608880 /NCGR_PEP_ID=MMETSP0449_2-20121227/890_1 /TAXON_ID=1082188 /ORGANISM="Strombidium rassoulzadegani, Strain ras09" /LENGTH=139 /DNA_ID=CAMNT_0008648949 /DNA_START=91 /DNA_END=510 /DNA_ORIENTATION=+
MQAEHRKVKGAEGAEIEEALNLIPEKLLVGLEKIAGKTRNIQVSLCVVKIVDILLMERWFSVANKDIWTVIYFVNFLFSLHDVFVGSLISQRLIVYAEQLILQILNQRGEEVNLEQSYEINQLLNCQAIRGSKVLLEFE